MREKAKELQRAKMDSAKKGGKAGGGGMGGMGSMGGMGGFTPNMPSSDITPAEPPRPAYNPPVKSSNKAMKLGGKTRDVDSFVDQLVQEGEKVSTTVVPAKTGLSKPSSAPQINTEAVHVTLEEKMILTAGRDGGLQTMEVLGLLTLRVQEEKVGRVRLELQNTENKAVQLQTHPNIDKDLFRTKSIIGLKNPAKPFPSTLELVF